MKKIFKFILIALVLIFLLGALYFYFADKSALSIQTPSGVVI